MGNETEPYKPIDCDVHDRLLERATLRRPTEVTYRNDQGSVAVCHDVIEDVFSRRGAEYVRLRSGVEVRLDKLIRLRDSGDIGGP